MKNGKKYYNGGMRLMRDGIPCKVAPWVAELTQRSRAELIQGSSDNIGSSKKMRETAAMERHPETTYFLFEAEQETQKRAA